MPLSIPPKRVSTVAFFYGMITGEFACARVPVADFEADALATRWKKEISYDDAAEGYLNLLAEACIYTETLTFNWPKTIEVPEEYRALEGFWKLYRSGAEGEAIRYNFANVANAIFYGQRDKFLGWRGALMKAMQVWTPPTEWKLEDELTDEERADPN